jgi:hypothetical protein
MKPAGLLQTTATAKRFETISFDLFGPLPPTPAGETWIFIVEDIASRWVELFALQTATAEACAVTLINEIFLRYGMPRRLISDNGPQFVSSVMQQVTYCLGIKHNLTPVYHPEANPVERRNRDLKTQLSILVQDDHRQWADKLPIIRFAMNTAQQSSTGFSPAYLTFGRELRTTDDTYNDLREIILNENFIAEITPKLILLSETLKRAREVQEQKEETRKGYVDKTRRSGVLYNAGTLVLVKTHPISRAAQGVSAKFAPRRDGPYIITKQHGPSSYQLALANTPDTAVGIYHASALEPYHGPKDELPVPVQAIRKRGRPKKNVTSLPMVRKQKNRN